MGLLYFEYEELIEGINAKMAFNGKIVFYIYLKLFSNF